MPRTPTAVYEPKISFLALVGRILVSAIFIISGIGKILNWGAMEGYLAAHGVPVAPFFLFIATVVEIVGGLSILFGVQARWGALILFLYLIPVSLIIHDFWAYAGAARQVELVNFLKNLAIMGGLFELVAFGPGLFSVDESSYHRGPGSRGGSGDTGEAPPKLRRVS